MTPAELVRDATSRPLSDERGREIRIELRPGLSPAEIDEFAQRLPCALPGEIRDLLVLCQGFEGGPVDFVDFTGEECSFEYAPAFPHGHPIAADGFGNFWVVDLLPTSSHWGPIYFACHDAPVILYMSPSLDHFLTELFRCCQPPHVSLVNDVHDDLLFEVWRTNPGVISQTECLTSTDPDLSAFARSLDPSFQIIDLRLPDVGFGFSWGRYGPNTVVRRHGELPLFAYQKRPGLLRRLFS